MMPTLPPRLALALLRCVASGNEPLVGDLIEEFQSGRSASWFWRQVVMATVTRILHRRHAGTVLLDIDVRRPQEGAGELGLPARAHLAPLVGLMNINSIQASGIGGLGLVVVALMIVLEIPQLQTPMLAAVCGGILVGVAMVLFRRRRGLSGPDDKAPGNTFHQALHRGLIDSRLPSDPKLHRLAVRPTAI